MSAVKHKEPLVAVLLSLIFTGLGQIYAGRMKRGIILLCLWSCVGNIIIAIVLLPYVVDPDIKCHFSYLLLIPLVIGFAFFVPMDAYKLAKSWNAEHNLERRITTRKKIFLIVGILFLLFVLNPSEIGTFFITRYLRANVVQSFHIPSDSMQPTLMKGDRLLVDKTIYRRSEPQRGDLIVFNYPPDPKVRFLKRLVGLPGDTIEIREGHLVINGIVQTKGRFGELVYNNDVPYADNGQITTVLPDSYFVLGDNSINSMDSRLFGFVPKKNLLGKAYKIYWPLDRSGRLE